MNFRFKNGTLLEQFDRTPVTFAVLLAYLALAVLTEGMEYRLLLEYGSGDHLLIATGEPWRLLACAFLHGGFLHLAFNSYCVYTVGPMLEESLGSVKFAILYIVTALAGTTLAVLWDWSPWASLVGGSGACFGMFGAIVAMQARHGRNLTDFLALSGPRSILMLIGINLLIGAFADFISNTAHIGGLIAGFVLTFMFLDRGRLDAPDATTRVAQAGWVAVFVAGLGLSLAPVGSARYVEERAWARQATPSIIRSNFYREFPTELAWLRDAKIEGYVRLGGHAD